MLHLTIPESEGSSVLPEQPQPPARAAVATVTQEMVKKHKQDKNPETLEKLGKLEFWGDFVVLFFFFFLSPEESFEKGSPHYCPVHHITFQFWALRLQVNLTAVNCLALLVSTDLPGSCHFGLLKKRGIRIKSQPCCWWEFYTFLPSCVTCAFQKPTWPRNKLLKDLHNAWTALTNRFNIPKVVKKGEQDKFIFKRFSMD